MPVVIARKAPVLWDRTLSSNGMFDIGDIMVWIHEIPQTNVGRDLNDSLRCSRHRQQHKPTRHPPLRPFSAGDAHAVIHEAKLERSLSVDA